MVLRIVLYINLLNETKRVRKCFQGSKKPRKTHVVTLKCCKFMSWKSIAVCTSGVPRNFFRGGVQQIQLRTERTGILGR